MKNESSDFSIELKYTMTSEESGRWNELNEEERLQFVEELTARLADEVREGGYSSILVYNEDGRPVFKVEGTFGWQGMEDLCRQDRRN